MAVPWPYRVSAEHLSASFDGENRVLSGTHGHSAGTGVVTHLHHSRLPSRDTSAARMRLSVVACLRRFERRRVLSAECADAESCDRCEVGVVAGRQVEAVLERGGGDEGVGQSEVGIAADPSGALRN
jgi:hypothetical protein